jgi:RNA polymerase sigma factor (TIGR02999 family)
MSDVTGILFQKDQGDPHAAEQLLPLVYEELRKLAAARLAREMPGQTLQATALVHEAYLRLVDVERAQRFNSRGHFFAAAAEAMRRILIETARSRQRQKRGGDRKRVDPSNIDLVTNLAPDELLLLNDSLDALAAHDQPAADLVKLRYFAGLTVEQAAEALGISRTVAYRHWKYARAWIFAQMRDTESAS